MTLGMLLVALTLFAWNREASAFRPFDGTDASVVDPEAAEIELGPLGFARDGGQRFLVAPMAALNHGLAPGWEASLQGNGNYGLSPGAKQASLTDDGVFFKAMLHEGSLQDKYGPSIATEFGVVLPGINAESGAGGSISGIVSQRWPWMTAHFNAQAELTRQHSTDLLLDLMLEGPHDWKVRPAAEVIGERDFGGISMLSGLIGAIWQARDDLAFDAGVRAARINDVSFFEIRAGVTFDFRLGR